MVPVVSAQFNDRPTPSNSYYYNTKWSTDFSLVRLTNYNVVHNIVVSEYLELVIMEVVGMGTFFHNPTLKMLNLS